MVICRFSKYAHFIPLAHPFSGRDIAKSFLDFAVKLHGVPLFIVSNRDKIFTSLFSKDLFKLLDITLCYSAAYHPESDGQSERLNQCLEGYLRSMTFYCTLKMVQMAFLG